VNESGEIFDINAKTWLVENNHFRSFNGCMTPRKDPPKAKKLILKRKLKPMPRRMKALWIVKNIAFIKKNCPEML